MPGHVLPVLERDGGVEFGLRRRLAVALYAEGALSMGGAAELADMSYMDFREYLGQFGLGLCYTMEMLEEDVRTLKELGFL